MKITEINKQTLQKIRELIDENPNFLIRRYLKLKRGIGTRTIREWLNDEKFDWSTGTLLVQRVKENDYGMASPGWASREDLMPVEKITLSDTILDIEFDSGYGSPQCPRFFARDAEAVYFPSQYDGSTNIEKVFIDPGYYLNLVEAMTPYPGGG